MTQLTCPSCGLEFETRATTNTRCRQCRKVINLSRSGRARALDQFDEETEGSGWVLAVFGVAAAALIWFFGRSK